MYEFADIHRLPRGGVDPITCPYDALRVVIFSMSSPPCAETIALTLDRDRRGRNILIVHHTPDPDAMLGIVDMITHSAADDPDIQRVVLATVRPGGGAVYDDLARWDEADDVCDAAGLELVEWFVLGAAISCPRELCGTEARWVA